MPGPLSNNLIRPASIAGSQKPLAFVITTGAEIIFEGDSLFTSYGLSAGEDVPTYFSTYGNTDITITNVAASGNGLSDIVSQYAAQVYPRRTAATGKPSATLFICIGSNDIAGLAAGTHLTYANVAAWYTALAGYITTAVADGFIVFVNTITPRADYNYIVDATRQQMNDLIRQNVTAAGKVDMARRFQSPSAADTFWLDGTHFTIVGRRVWAQVLVDTVIGNRAYGPVDNWLPQGSTIYPAILFQGPAGLFCPEPGRIGFVGASAICRAYVDGDDGSFILTPFSGSHVWKINAGFTDPVADVDIALPVVSGTLATIAGTEALTNKTVNGNTIANGSGNIATTSLAYITPGTGIATALGTNIGSAGAPVLFNGAGGTPSSGTLTNCTGLPAAGVVGTAAVLGANTFTASQSVTLAQNGETNITVTNATNGASAGAFIKVASDTANGSIEAFSSINNFGDLAGKTAFTANVGAFAVVTVQSQPIQWYTGGLASGNKRMTLSAAGGLSIGTATDAGATNLLVAGTVTVTGVTTHTGGAIMGAALRLKGYTVATLPGGPTQGDTAAVTDALTPAFLTIIVGGGSTYCPVVFNGTNWVGY